MTARFENRGSRKGRNPFLTAAASRKFSQLAQHAFCKLPQERFIFLTHHTAFLFPHATRYNPKATLARNACPCQRLLSFFCVRNPLKRLVFWFSPPHIPSNLVCRSSVCDLIASENSYYYPSNDDRSRTPSAFPALPAIERIPPKLNSSIPSHQPSYSYIEGY